MLKEPLESAPGSVLLLFRFSSEKPGWAGWPVVLKPCTWNPSNTSLPWLWCWMSWSASFLTDGEKQVMDWLKWNSKRMQDVVFFFYQTRYYTVRKTDNYQSVHIWIHTTNNFFHVSGDFYRTMQQWGFQKQAQVDLLQALFIPARGFSRSYRLN